MCRMDQKYITLFLISALGYRKQEIGLLQSLSEFKPKPSRLTSTLCFN